MCTEETSPWWQIRNTQRPDYNFWVQIYTTSFVNPWLHWRGEKFHFLPPFWEQLVAATERSCMWSADSGLIILQYIRRSCGLWKHGHNYILNGINLLQMLPFMDKMEGGCWKCHCLVGLVLNFTSLHSTSAGAILQPHGICVSASFTRTITAAFSLHCDLFTELRPITHIPNPPISDPCRLNQTEHIVNWFYQPVSKWAATCWNIASLTQPSYLCKGFPPPYTSSILVTRPWQFEGQQGSPFLWLRKLVRWSTAGRGFRPPNVRHLTRAEFEMDLTGNDGGKTAYTITLPHNALAHKCHISPGCWLAFAQFNKGPSKDPDKNHSNKMEHISRLSRWSGKGRKWKKISKSTNEEFLRGGLAPWKRCKSFSSPKANDFRKFCN